MRAAFVIMSTKKLLKLVVVFYCLVMHGSNVTSQVLPYSETEILSNALLFVTMPKIRT